MELVRRAGEWHIQAWLKELHIVAVGGGSLCGPLEANTTPRPRRQRVLGCHAGPLQGAAASLILTWMKCKTA